MPEARLPNRHDAANYIKCRTEWAASMPADRSEYLWLEFGDWLELVESDGWLENMHRSWNDLAKYDQLPKRPQVDFDFTPYRGGAWRCRLDLNFRPFTVANELVSGVRGDWQINLLKLRMDEMHPHRPQDFWKLCCFYAIQTRAIQRLARETDLIVRGRLRLIWHNDKLLGWDVIDPSTVSHHEHRNYVEQNGIDGLLERWSDPYPDPPERIPTADEIKRGWASWRPPEDR
jgi:hypothetical protein